MNFIFLHIGGVELVFTKLAEGLAARGHQVKVITTRLKGMPHTDFINGVEIYRLGGKFVNNRFFFSLLAIKTALILTKDSQVLHTSAYNGAIPAYVASRSFAKPIVFTAPEILGKRWHTVESNPFKAVSYRLFEYVVAKLPYDRIVAISQATLRDLLALGVNRDRASILYLGIDEDVIHFSKSNKTLRENKESRENEFLYAYFGRPGITKGVEILLNTAPLVQKRIPTARLLLILAT